MSEWSVADPSDGQLAVCAAILLFGAVLAEEPPHTANPRALEIWRRPYVVLYHHAAGRTWGSISQFEELTYISGAS